MSLVSLPDILYAHSVTGFGMFAAPSDASRALETEAEVGLGIDSVAERRRKKKNDLLPLKDRVKTARLFGFNKIAVCLSSRYHSVYVLSLDLLVLSSRCISSPELGTSIGSSGYG